jgi:hypothetical protein
VLLLMSWLLVGCGGALSNAAPPPSSDGAAQPGLQIARQAECAFPATMRVGQPATIRFSIFAPGSRPAPLPGATTALDPFQIEARPDLETWVGVSLTANGVPVVQDPGRQLQRLSEGSNSWVWQITPADTQQLVLQPLVDVEFRDAAGNVIERRQSAWTQTYVVGDVVGAGPIQLAATWLGNSVQELITGMIGAALLRLGTGARSVIGERLRKQRG